MIYAMRPMDCRFRVRVRRPVDFVRAGIEHFPGDCYLSLEGDLSQLDPAWIPRASLNPTVVLPRNTLSPVQDFVILPVTAATRDFICRVCLPQIGLRHRVIHVQIAAQGRLVLGAYDNFHRDCAWIDAAIGQVGIRSMLDSGIIGWYELCQNDEQ